MPIGDGRSIVEKLIPLPLVAMDLKEELASRTGKPQIAIESLPILNDKIWGFKEKEIVVVGARPSQGKSTFALQLGIDFANQSIPTWVCSLEMDSISLLERAYCHVMNEINTDLQRGDFDRAKFKSFEKYLEEVQLMITHDLGKNWKDILDSIELMNPQPKVVILDYIQLIRMSKRDTKDSIDEYLSEFKRLAIERSFCGIICSQINRGAITGDNLPSMGMLKSSGAIEEIADKILLLHWDYFYDKSVHPNLYKIITAKNRNGATGIHEVIFDFIHYRFKEKKLTDMTEMQRNN